VAFSADGKLLASAGASKDVQLWDFGSGKELKPFKGHTRWVRFCAFSPDGRMLASAGLDNVVRVWDVATRRQVAELTGHQRRIHFVTFSHSGRQLATAGMDRTVKLWDTPKLAHSPASPTIRGGGEGGGSGSGVRDACRAESERLCAGDERVGRCLRAQTDQLSAGCKAALDSRRGGQ
jgi:WD40 repeat protein